MSFLLENSFHFQDVQSVLTSWITQYEQHDILLICNLGQRVTTRQSFLSLHSPLIRTLLDNIPPSVDIPAISVNADIMDVSGLICLLTTGNTSSEYVTKLEEVEKAAESLGITQTNCEIVDKTSKITPVVDFINPIQSVVKKIVMNTLSLEETVDQNCASTTMASLKIGRVCIATSIFKTKDVKEKSVFPVSRKIDRIGRKIKKKYEMKEIDQNLPTISQTHVCKICDRSFAIRTSLSRHCRTEHSDITDLRCLMCGKQFKNKYILGRHVDRIVCGDNKSFVCKNCGKRFHCNSALRKHSSIHLTGKQFICVICGKQFAQKSNMKTHKNRYHTGADCLSEGEERIGDMMYESDTNFGKTLKTPEEDAGDEEVPDLACE